MSKILQENILHGEFTFGFELEAYVDGAEIPTDPNSSTWEEVLDLSYNNPSEYPTMEDVMLNLDYNNELLSELYSFDDVEKVVGKKMNNLFPQNEPWIIKPSTGVTYDGSLGVCGFEWPSPTMKFTPEAIHSCISFLKNLKKEDIYVDETCGFHVHLAYPNITEQDAIWIVCNLAMDTEFQKEIIALETDDYYFDFVGYYANPDYLDYIRYAINDGDFAKLSSMLDNTKYRLLRIHPQGTLEWRGPRDFISYDNTIKPFFTKLYQFVSWISHVMDKKTIGDYTKENFLSMINPSVKFGKPSVNMIYTMERLWNNPRLIQKMGSMTYQSIIKLADSIVPIDGMNYSGYSIFYKAVSDCVIKHNLTIPSKFLAHTLCRQNLARDYKCDIIRHLHQPIPVKEMQKICKLMNLESWQISSLLFMCMESYSIDDIIQIIKDIDLNDYKTIIKDVAFYWRNTYKGTPIPPKISVTIMNKYNLTSAQLEELF